MVNRDERRWALGLAVFLLILTSVPYLLGYFSAGTSWVFTGFIFGVEDGNSYIAKMLSGAAGNWLFRTPYTAVAQKGFLAFLPYLLLGKLTAPPGQHEEMVALFQLFRWVGGLMMMMATYDFCAVFLHQVRWRRLATGLICAGGGLGWLAVTGLSGLWKDGLPLEFYSPETFGFLSLLGLPHLAVARALLLWGLVFALRAAGHGDMRLARLAGLLWLIMGFFQPLTVVTGWAVLGGFGGLLALRNWTARKTNPDWASWRGLIKVGLWIGIISAPMVVYNFAAFQFDPFLRGWARQNLILSPPPLDYLLGFALVLPLSLWGLWQVVRRGQVAEWLPVAWVVLFPLLAYAPYQLQRRLPDGIWVALVVLAVLLIEKLNLAWTRRVVWGLSLAFLPAAIFLLGAGITASQPRQPVFRPRNEVSTFTALAQQAKPGDVVLAAYGSSNALPAWAPVRVLIGHGPESVNLKEVQPRVEQFFAAGITDEQRKDLLREFGVDWILVGPEERALGNWQPAAGDGLTLILDLDDYQIYRVDGMEKP